MKKYTENDLREAFKAGKLYGSHNSYFNQPLDENEWIKDYTNPIEKDEETVPITLGVIRKKCGWSKFCDVTDGNHHMLNEWDVSDREIFDVQKSHAEQLGLI